MSPVAAGHSFGWLVNAQRHAHGLPVLANSPSLCPVALWRSQDMVARHYFSHDIPGQPGRVFAVLDKRGIPYTVAGEIIGWYSGPSADAYPFLVHAFMKSSSHRAIILGRWTGMCAGVVAKGSRVTVTVLFEIGGNP